MLHSLTAVPVVLRIYLPVQFLDGFVQRLTAAKTGAFFAVAFPVRPPPFPKKASEETQFGVEPDPVATEAQGINLQEP